MQNGMTAGHPVMARAPRSLACNHRGGVVPLHFWLRVTKTTNYKTLSGQQAFSK